MPKLNNDQTIDPDNWLKYLSEKYSMADLQLLKQCYALCRLVSESQVVFTGIICTQHALAIADILANLNVDIETIAAGLLFPAVEYADLALEDIEEQFGAMIAKLVTSVKKMDVIRTFHSKLLQRGQHPTQIDNVRKMLLAMAEDIRVVLIKLAERTVVMRELHHLDNHSQQIALAKEIQDIYAPLANRLGIASIKWELEDIAFAYLQPDIYEKITRDLAMKKSERELYINKVSELIKEALQKIAIKDFKISGRAKHIYSIHRKMQRKSTSFGQIFDVSAIRILVPSLEDCYAALGVVHTLWQSIPEAFDDYIAQPKQNGYRSLHTAIIGPNGHHLEIQIRTYLMHQESELGIAAHWIYKEAGEKSHYDQKILWLRQIMDWQSEVMPIQQIFQDRVYVFTPTDDIIDLPKNATSLDFAYYIHTQLGHRCRGAKVNGKIVPLTYPLKTGDRIHILTSKYPNPSRDWINPNLGYLTTARAKAKVHHWFKQQDYDKNLAEGHELLKRELKRLHLKNVELNQIAEKYHQPSIDDLLAAIGAGDIRLGQLIHTIENLQHPKIEPTQTPTTPTSEAKILQTDIYILGVHNLLTRIAHCCKPIPGNRIIGYITRGRGISIHRQDCPNILTSSEQQKKRLIEVSWSKKNV